MRRRPNNLQKESSKVSTRSSSRAISLIVTFGFVMLAAWMVINRQAVVDWWRLSQYKPSAAVKQLADNDTMIGRGRDLFYISDPQIQDSAAFNKACKNEGEKTIVLGCYKLQDIYLYNVTDARFNGVKEVTAAHEMLHAAYERLSGDEQSKLKAMLSPIIENMKDQRILDLIKLYNKTEPGQLYNEMHSILGTEYRTLTPELENYYKQYFSDRSKVVSYAEAYQGPFVESQHKIDEYSAQLAAMKTRIDQNNESLKLQQADLQAENRELDRLRGSDLDAYNAAVPAYNAKVEAFNEQVEQTKTLIASYNALVEAYNAQAAAQDNLYQNLDSSYQPATQN